MPAAPPVVAVGPPSAPPHLAGVRVAALLGVRLLDGTVADVALDGDRIAAVRPASGDPTPPAPGVALDARGWRFVPAASEPHAHLDKALTAARMPPGTGHDLVGAITAWTALVPGIDAADVHTRARLALERYAAAGTTTVRTHVDAPREGDPLRLVDGVLALREELAGALTLQVCLLSNADTPTAVVVEALARGVDVVGGVPHLAPDPHAETTRLLDVAERTGAPVDLHADEQTTLPAATLDVVDLAQQVLARGLAQRVVASHVVRLGSLTPRELEPVLALVARAGLGVVTLPITNLYLQGRGASPGPRGLPPLRALVDAGLTLAAGGDNLRDPFNPAGRADPFETASLLVTAGHLTPHEALAAVTTGPRAVLGLAPVGAVAGAGADVVLVPDDADADPADPRGQASDGVPGVVAGPGEARVVVHAGRVVADTRVQRTLALQRP